MGLERCRFKKGEAVQRLLCCICSEVLSSPVQCSLCRSFLCKSCIGVSSPSSCPHSELVPVSKFLTLKLKEMELRCKYYPHGCEVWCRVKDVGRHEAGCQFACAEDCEGKENVYGKDKLQCSDCKTKMVLCRAGCGRLMTAEEGKRHNCMRDLMMECQKKAEKVREMKVKVEDAVREKKKVEEELYVLSQTVSSEVRTLERRLDEIDTEKRRVGETYEERLLASQSLCEDQAGGYLRQQVDLLAQLSPTFDSALIQTDHKFTEFALTLGRRHLSDMKNFTVKTLADVYSFVDSKPKPPKFISQFRPTRTRSHSGVCSKKTYT